MAENKSIMQVRDYEGNIYKVCAFQGQSAYDLARSEGYTDNEVNFRKSLANIGPFSWAWSINNKTELIATLSTNSGKETAVSYHIPKIPEASVTTPGIVTASDQIFGGGKTFTKDLTLSNLNSPSDLFKLAYRDNPDLYLFGLVRNNPSGFDNEFVLSWNRIDEAEILTNNTFYISSKDLKREDTNFNTKLALRVWSKILDPDGEPVWTSIAKSFIQSYSYETSSFIGTNMLLEAGNNLFMGSGYSPTTFYENQTSLYDNNYRDLFLLSDRHINIYTNLQSSGFFNPISLLNDGKVFIRSIGQSISWQLGRDLATIQITPYKGYHCLASLPISQTSTINGQTIEGTVDLGTYQTYFSIGYISPGNYNDYKQGIVSGKRDAGVDFDFINEYVRPYPTATLALGTSGYKWKQIWCSNSLNSTSDIRLKNVLPEEVLDSLIKMYDLISPIAYRVKNISINDTHDRVHVGLSAQNVEEKLFEVGLSRLDFGGLLVDPVYSKDENGEDTTNQIDEQYGLRYGEFHGLHILKNQQQDSRIKLLEEKNQQLENTISELKTQIELLKLAIGG